MVRCFVYESVFIYFVIHTADFFLSVYICECSIDFVKTGDKQISGCDTSVFIKLFFHVREFKLEFRMRNTFVLVNLTKFIFI